MGLVNENNKYDADNDEDVELYDNRINNSFSENSIIKEFLTLTEFECKRDNPDLSVSEGTCNFSDDYIAMLNHKDVFRYDKTFNQSIELDEAFLRKSYY